MADAPDSKSGEGNLVRVQLPPPAYQSFIKNLNPNEVKGESERNDKKRYSRRDSEENRA